MSFKEKHEYVLKTYNKILNGVTDLIRNDFDFEVTHNDKHITSKTLSYKDGIKTDFHDERLPPGKTNSRHIQ